MDESLVVRLARTAVDLDLELHQALRGVAVPDPAGAWAGHVWSRKGRLDLGDAGRVDPFDQFLQLEPAIWNRSNCTILSGFPPIRSSC